jgi:uncharacterized protein YceH (UPF0502 family)
VYRGIDPYHLVLPWKYDKDVIMSPADEHATPAIPGNESRVWPVLTLHERRVLGVLAEKAKTTPDVYPLSVNALVTGCNQKSNRDPVLNLTDLDVEDALISAQQKGLAIKITGSGRVVRWRHALYEAFQVDKKDLAILAELLLRGPQTEGELRSRASRMERFDDLDALRAVLRPLTERRLVVYLSPEGRRGAMLTDGFHAPDELERLQTRHAAVAEGEAAPTRAADARSLPAPADSDTMSAIEGRLDAQQAELAAVRAQVSELQTAVTALAKQVLDLKGILDLRG